MGTAEPTLGETVRSVASSFAKAGIPAPMTEARDLVAAVLDKPRFWPALHATQRADEELVRQVTRAAVRRVAGAPFQYAVGRAAFRFLNLEVDERVLIPRPETERLVELVLAAPQGRRGGVAADIGTGSGAIALALSAEARFDLVIATDVSNDALHVARRNADVVRESLQSAVEFRAGSGLAPLRGMRVDVLVSNPPYIAYEELADLPRLVRDWEPSQALCCSDRGLALTREIASQAAHVVSGDGLLALEVDSRRASAVAELVEGTGAFRDVRVLRDYSGRDRFVMATRLAVH
jgi:release factor glutamine methyltransferase